MTRSPAPATPPKQPRYRIAIIQEKENLEDVYKTRTVIGLLPYEESECDRLMRFMSEPYARSRPVAASQPTPEIRSMREDEDGHISWQRMNERTLADHDAAIRNEVLDEVYNKIDGKRVCKWGESERCEVLDLVESFRTISTTGDKGGE